MTIYLNYSVIRAHYINFLSAIVGFFGEILPKIGIIQVLAYLTLRFGSILCPVLTAWQKNE